MNEFSSISPNDKSINSTNFIHSSPRNINSFLSNQNRTSEPFSERSNSQFQSFTGMQSFSFIGIKDKSGKKNGFGIQKFTNSSIYKGNFIEDKPEGWGILYHSDGDMHKGYYENGITKGYGEYYHLNEVVYYGYFFDDIQKGIGYEIW